MKNPELLVELAGKISDETRRKSAVALAELIGSEIDGIGDEPVKWHPSTLKLVQGTTDRGNIPKGAVIGSLVLDDTILASAEDEFKVIPIRAWNGRQMWSPDETEAKVVCYSPDSKTGSQYGECKTCHFGQWNAEENKSNGCNKTHSFAVIDEALSTFFYVNYSKSGYSLGTDWVNKMKKAGSATYKRTYALFSKTNPERKNVEQLLVKPVGKVEDDAELAFLEELFTQFSEDRKEYLARFTEAVTMRLDSASGSEAALEDKSGSGETKLLEPATEKADEAPAQVGYTL